MVTKRGRRSRRFISIKVAWLTIVIVAATGCQFLLSTPYPGYLGELQALSDVAPVLDDILPRGMRARFEMHAFEFPSLAFAPDRLGVVVLVTPIVPEDYTSEGPAPVPYLMFFDENLQFLGRVGEPDELRYLGRPIGIAADGTFFSGSLPIDTDEFEPQTEVPNLGITGFAVTYAANTYLIATRPGAATSAHIVYRRFTDAWVREETPESLAILPPADDEQPAREFRLLKAVTVGEETEAEFEFMLLEPAEQAVYFVRRSAADFAAGLGSSPGDTLTTREQLGPAIEIGTGVAYHVPDGLALRRRDGWFEYLNRDGSRVARTAVERATGRVFAFSPDGARFFRFDPVTRKLSAYGTWW
ncbi:MAG: hypothetical protein EA426_05440 [Spirochaetaceae bacterium]|nr:MAG: hypothetical protein EA426_05440 [Spirochaetaceae bacterium]